MPNSKRGLSITYPLMKLSGTFLSAVGEVNENGDENKGMGEGGGAANRGKID